MNAWDWYIIQRSCLFLVSLTILVIFIVMMLKNIGCFWVIYPFSFLKKLIFGSRYAVKVNGVWSLCRGRISKNEDLIIKYGKDKHKWELSYDKFEKINERWSNKKAQEYIMYKNIVNLNNKHPQKGKPRIKSTPSEFEFFRFFNQD